MTTCVTPAEDVAALILGRSLSLLGGGRERVEPQLALQVGRGRVSAGGQSRWPNAALNFPDDD